MRAAALRHRALQLALVVVSTVGQGSLVAYFLRRDLFSTLVSFIADAETKPFAFEATLLLGLLANYRKCEARNPYGVRIEDFVEEGVMEVRPVLFSLPPREPSVEQSYFRDARVSSALGTKFVTDILFAMLFLAMLLLRSA